MQIRNIMQTVQEREIIKVAPDLVVYLDKLPFLLNSYVTDVSSAAAGTVGTVVSFNQHVTAFSANYDTDMLKPGCTVNLSIPNQLKYLYKMPGGNNLITSMMDLQVFMKGYFLSSRGNSVYRRVFKGVVTSVSANDNGKTLDIAISGAGVLRFLELMQVDLNPAMQTNSASSATNRGSKYYNLSPYQQIQAMFDPADLLQGFQTAETLAAGANGIISNSPYFGSIQAGYVAKWQTTLAELSKFVHIFGTRPGDDLPEGAIPVVPEKAAHHDAQAGPHSVENGMVFGNTKGSEWGDNLYLDFIREFQPDYGLAPLNLLTGRPISRLERMRAMIEMIGFEGYQDLDGSIIVKPPLYNMDVTLVDDPVPSVSTSAQSYAYTPITKDTNPFVVHLSEILSESEHEDETGIRYTRMLVKGDTSRQPIYHMNEMLSAAEFVDVDKLAKFGLREESCKTLPWFEPGDKNGLFAAAVNELVRGNRGYRTYTITIPVRPEIKLGFPMYIPHKDMYGYIKSVSINYQMGSDATMSITLDAIRKRPMFAVTQQNSDKSVSTYYSKRPNLCYVWSELKETGSSKLKADGTLVNVPGTLLTSTQLTPAQKQILDYRNQKMQNYMSVNPSTHTHYFHLVADDANAVALMTDDVQAARKAAGTIFSPSSTNGSLPPGFSVNAAYFSSLLRAQPYTDEKGYEVLAPFPWGRFTTLKQAITLFTEGGAVSSSGYTGKATSETNLDALLFAGILTPSAQPQTVDSQLLQSETAANSLDATAVFELVNTSADPHTPSPTASTNTFTSTMVSGSTS